MGLTIAADSFFTAPSAFDAASLLQGYNFSDSENVAVLGADLSLLQTVGYLSGVDSFLQQIEEGRLASLNPVQREKFLGALARFLEKIPQETWARLRLLSGSASWGERRHLEISTRRFGNDPRAILAAWQNSRENGVEQRVSTDGAAKPQVSAAAHDSSAARIHSGDPQTAQADALLHSIKHARALAKRGKYDSAAEVMVSVGLEIQKLDSGVLTSPTLGKDEKITPENCFKEAARYYGEAAEQPLQDPPKTAARLLKKMVSSYLVNGQWFDAEEALFSSHYSLLQKGLDPVRWTVAKKMVLLMRAEAAIGTRENAAFVSREFKYFLGEMGTLDVETKWALPPSLRLARARTAESARKTMDIADSLYLRGRDTMAVEHYKTALQAILETTEPVFVKTVFELLGNSLGLAFLRRVYPVQTLQPALDFLGNSPPFSAEDEQQIEMAWITEEAPPVSFEDALAVADRDMDAGLMMGERTIPVVTFYKDDARHTVTPTDLFLQATHYFRMARQWQLTSPQTGNTHLHIPLKGALAYLFAGNIEKSLSILIRYEQNPVIRRVMGAVLAETAPRASRDKIFQTPSRAFALVWRLLDIYNDDERLSDAVRRKNAEEFRMARTEAAEAQKLSDAGNLPAAEEKFANAVSRMRRIVDPQFAVQIMTLLGDTMGRAFVRFFYEDEAYTEVLEIMSSWRRYPPSSAPSTPAQLPPRPVFTLFPSPPPHHSWVALQRLLPPLPQRQPTLRELIENAIRDKKLTDETLRAMAKMMGTHHGKRVDPEILRHHLVAYGDLFVALVNKAGFQPYERRALYLKLHPPAMRMPPEKQ
ncbi:MAG: hypothetical protein A3H42_02075 [Deltaproteobacteria bacterium RIFCSPLOWO2_02_FULL_46_8]|nr:MAG: hypothetical protein A3H42_02075 [Deltaproteobacteria bacterium RIFCSPLOWO2_02_FULL_46_8]